MSSLTLTHADRLFTVRKGIGFLPVQTKQFNVSIQILDDPEGEAFETELVKDVITLMTVFSAHLLWQKEAGRIDGPRTNATEFYADW